MCAYACCLQNRPPSGIEPESLQKQEPAHSRVGFSCRSQARLLRYDRDLGPDPERQRLILLLLNHSACSERTCPRRSRFGGCNCLTCMVGARKFGSPRLGFIISVTILTESHITLPFGFKVFHSRLVGIMREQNGMIIYRDLACRCGDGKCAEIVLH